MSSGEQIFLAFKKQSEMFKSDEFTLSGALIQDKAGWAIDDETLLTLRIEKIEIVGIVVKETRDIYLTRLENFTDHDKAVYGNYSGRGGGVMRFLPSTYFSKNAGVIRVK